MYVSMYAYVYIIHIYNALENSLENGGVLEKIINKALQPAIILKFDSNTSVFQR